MAKKTAEAHKEVKPKPKPIIGLGLDPGKSNFGVALIAARSMEDYCLIDSAQLYSVQSQDTIVEPKFIQSVIDDILSWVVLGEVQFITIERYHPRGNFVPMDQVEYVNVMIGAAMVALSSLKIPIHMVTASAWKRVMYPTTETWTYLDWFKDSFSEHAGDAACMCLSSLYTRGLIPWSLDE